MKRLSVAAASFHRRKVDLRIGDWVTVHCPGHRMPGLVQEVTEKQVFGRYPNGSSRVAGYCYTIKYLLPNGSERVWSQQEEGGAVRITKRM